MEYRTLPNGGKISTIGIGVGNYGYEKPSLTEVERIFAVAFERGVNFFDTCMSISYPAETIAKAIQVKRDQRIMQNHLCVGYPNGEYRQLKKIVCGKRRFRKGTKKIRDRL